jgi:hypothetical protein
MKKKNGVINLPLPLKTEYFEKNSLLKKELEENLYSGKGIDFPLISNSKRIIRKLKLLETGYHTYGDYEDILSYYLSLIYNYENLKKILYYCLKEIENIEAREGLVNFLINNLNERISDT